MVFRQPAFHWQKLLHQRAGLGGPGGALRRGAKAGAQQQHGGLLPPEQRHIFRRNTALCALLTGAQAALRQAGCGGAHHRFHTGKGHDARPGAQCALRGQQCSAPVECAARHGQHRTEGALVAVGRALGERIPNHIGRRCKHTLSPLFCRACPLRHCLRNATSPKGRGKTSQRADAAESGIALGSPFGGAGKAEGFD